MYVNRADRDTKEYKYEGIKNYFTSGDAWSGYYQLICKPQTYRFLFGSPKINHILSYFMLTFFLSSSFTKDSARSIAHVLFEERSEQNRVLPRNNFTINFYIIHHSRRSRALSLEASTDSPDWFIRAHVQTSHGTPIFVWMMDWFNNEATWAGKQYLGLKEG